MIIAGKIRVAGNGYGVIGKCVATAAVRLQKNMERVGAADVEAECRVRIEIKK